MNEQKEFNRIKTQIALNSIIKIFVFTIISISLVMLLADGFFNNELANFLSNSNDSFYLFLVNSKTAIILIVCLILELIVSFFVIKNALNSLIAITDAVNLITKNPDLEIKLDPNLAIIENKLNNIRINLIKSRNEAADAQNKKNDLIMYMAHDLKTPLTSVIGYLNLLSESSQLPYDLQKKYINIALDKSYRLEELTNQFFEITRYNLQDMPITKNKIDLSFLLEQLTDECYPMMKEKDLEFKISKPEHVFFVGDGDKLARAFENLIKNAINYSYSNSLIEISMTTINENIEIIFKNKGDKIPEYKLNRIFERFYRADESRNSSTGGTGLGLAITKQIIELHNGTINVKNDDEYIEFTISLPQ